MTGDTADQPVALDDAQWFHTGNRLENEALAKQLLVIGGFLGPEMTWEYPPTGC